MIAFQVFNLVASCVLLIFAGINLRNARRNSRNARRNSRNADQNVLNARVNEQNANKNARIAQGLASGNMNEVKKAIDEALRLMIEVDRLTSSQVVTRMMEDTMSAFIKHKDKLLQGIVEGLTGTSLGGCTPRTTLGTIHVAFETDDGTKYRFGLVQALYALANDVTWDERGNWSEAQVATVEVI